MDQKPAWTGQVDQERAAKAAGKARDRVLRHCARRITKAMKVIDDALEATEVKATYDSAEGKFAYSRALVRHDTRLKAAELVVEWSEAAPSMEVNNKHSGTITFNIKGRKIDSQPE